MINFLHANWPAPLSVQALSTKIHGGNSKIYGCATNNMATHINDNLEDVINNRCRLQYVLGLGSQPHWLNQTHSNDCVVLEETSNIDADASITKLKNRALAILTADCLPIIICSRDGQEIAAIHAGWRGLYNNIIENTIAKLSCKNNSYIAWIGPSICKKCFNVGEEVYNKIHDKYYQAKNAYTKSQDTHQYNIDLAYLAAYILRKNNIKDVFFSNMCTVECNNEFYSYRRNNNTGRIVTLIWIKE